MLDAERHIRPFECWLARQLAAADTQTPLPLPTAAPPAAAGTPPASPSAAAPPPPALKPSHAVAVVHGWLVAVYPRSDADARGDAGYTSGAGDAPTPRRRGPSAPGVDLALRAAILAYCRAAMAGNLAGGGGGGAAGDAARLLCALCERDRGAVAEGLEIAEAAFGDALRCALCYCSG
jgi:hypothetical protein